MKIKFCGAALCVTGSCYYIEGGGYKFLVDCGMFQGRDADKYNEREFPFNEEDIDFVLLTHAHIDHAGRLPLLVKNGFKGDIHTTKTTASLCDIMLYDSAHIQEVEAEWTNRKNKRGSLNEAYQPLYDSVDVDKTMPLFKGHKYNELIAISDTIKVRFVDAGHLLGSASIEVFITEKGKETKVVFSGDLGNLNQPIIKNSPTFIDDADIVLTESTYGDELHKESSAHITSADRVKRLAKLVDETFSKKGNLVIPAFAVGRTQEILYLFKLIQMGKLLPYEIPVFVDSPMAIKATEVFANEDSENFDEETRQLIKNGENPLTFPSLRIASSTEESKEINSFEGPCVIISASGMCSQGRIKHHLKHNLWRSESTILFTGYQAGGTLGRAIIDGAKTVTIFGEKISVNARIEQFSNLSGHADQSGIIRWLDNFDKKRIKEIFVVHGEKESAIFFQNYIKSELALPSYAPSYCEEIQIDDSLSALKPPKSDIKPREDNKSILAALQVLKNSRTNLDRFIEQVEQNTQKTSNNKASDWEDVNALLSLANKINDMLLLNNEKKQ